MFMGSASLPARVLHLLAHVDEVHWCEQAALSKDNQMDASLRQGGKGRVYDREGQGGGAGREGGAMGDAQGLGGQKGQP